MIIPFISSFNVVGGDTFVLTVIIHVSCNIRNATVTSKCESNFLLEAHLTSLVMSVLGLGKRGHGGINEMKTVQLMHPTISILKTLSRLYSE